MNPPITPKIYHITHYQNLESMRMSGAIFSDNQRRKTGGVSALQILSF